MRQRWLLNLGLLAAVALLAWLAYRQPGKELVAPAAITALTEAQVSHIEIQPRGQPAVVLDKQGGRWWMRSPFHVRADPTRVGFVLDFLHAKTATVFPVVDKDLPAYDLDKPRVTLTLNGQRFDFGGTNALSMDRYVRSGKQVFLVFDTSYPYLAADAASFVDPQLIDPGRHIRSIAIPGLKVMQKEGRLSATGNDPDVSADVLARFVENWRSARADSVHALDAETNSGGYNVTIDFDDGPPLQLQILQRQPDLVLAHPARNLAYHFAAEDAKSLLSLDKTTHPKK